MNAFEYENLKDDLLKNGFTYKVFRKKSHLNLQIFYGWSQPLCVTSHDNGKTHYWQELYDDHIVEITKKQFYEHLSLK